MISKKEMFKKRWLLVCSYVFTYIIPILIILEQVIIIRKSDINVGFHFFGVILGLIYIAFLRKKAKEKVETLKIGFFKEFLSGVLGLIPFGVVGLLTYAIINALHNFDKTITVLVFSMFIGVLLKSIDVAKNKKLIYNLRIYELAKEEVDKKKMIAQLEQEESELI